MTFQDVLDTARTLSVSDRLRLVDALWDDSAPENWPVPSDDWIAEVQRRSAESDAGQMTASSWSEVRDRARQKAAGRIR